MGDDRERKKSWREIDSGRDRSGGTRQRRDPGESQRERLAKSAAYSKYKSNLDKLFTPGGGGALPEALRAKLGPTDEGAQAKRKLFDDLKNNPNEGNLRAYLESKQTLPEDPRLLISLLDVVDEGLLATVLRRLLEVVEAGKKPSRMLLIQKLVAVRNRVEEQDTLDLVDSVRSALE